MQAVAALPLRVREVIGALHLFHTRPGAQHPADLHLSQALADAATIGILHQSLAHDQTELIGQLQTARNSRIVIEQAKGPPRLPGPPARRGLHRLRAHARAQRRSLTLLCAQVLESAVDAELFASAPDTRHRP